MADELNGNIQVIQINYGSMERIEEELNLSSEDTHRQNESRTHNQFDVPRPCYYLLRFLGIWQPKDCCFIWKLYLYFTWLILFGSITFIFSLTWIHSHTFPLYEVLNSIGTVVDFCCPFLFFKYYFWTGNYERLMGHVYENIDAEGTKKLRLYRYVYTVISLLVWSLMVAFFTQHWLPFPEASNEAVL